MATNAYLLFEGLPGPSTIKKDAVEVFSFSWGISSVAAVSSGFGASRAGRASFSDLTIMKSLDTTSKDIAQKCATNDAFTTVTLGYMKQMSDDNVEYFHIILKNAYVSSFQLSGSNENPMESVSITYDEVEFGYAPEKDDGKGVQGFLTMKYSVAENKKL